MVFSLSHADANQIACIFNEKWQFLVSQTAPLLVAKM